MLLQISSGCRYSVHTRAVPITVTDGAVGQKPSSYSEKMADCKGATDSTLTVGEFICRPAAPVSPWCLCSGVHLRVRHRRDTAERHRGRGTLLTGVEPTTPSSAEVIQRRGRHVPGL